MWRASWCRRPNCWPPPTSPTARWRSCANRTCTRWWCWAAAARTRPRTPHRYRALSAIPGVDVEVFDNADGQVPDLSLPADPSRRRIVFCSIPRPKIIGDSRVDAVAIRSGGTSHKVATDLVVRSIATRSTLIPGLAFDDERGVISNDDGRLLDESGQVIPGGYVVGWAKRGPNGGIGANKMCAIATVEDFIADAASGKLIRTRKAPRRSVRWSATRPECHRLPRYTSHRPSRTSSRRRAGASARQVHRSSPTWSAPPSLPSLMALFEVMPSGVERSPDLRDPRSFVASASGIKVCGRAGGASLSLRLRGQRCVVAIVVGMRLDSGGRCEGLRCPSRARRKPRWGTHLDP